MKTNTPVRARCAAYGLAHDRTDIPVVWVTSNTCGFRSARDRDAVMTVLRAVARVQNVTLFLTPYTDTTARFALSGINAKEVRAFLRSGRVQRLPHTLPSWAPHPLDTSERPSDDTRL